MHLLALFFPPVFGFGFLLYFLPAILGFAHTKRDAGAILVLNFFLGWTAIGWVIALVWALKQDAPLAIRSRHLDLSCFVRSQVADRNRQRV
jgi:Superinfection immunity protein